jgi:hypothetical protein
MSDGTSGMSQTEILAGLVRPALAKEPPDLEELKMYLGALRHLGEDVEAIYEQEVKIRELTRPDWPPAPTFDQLQTQR